MHGIKKAVYSAIYYVSESKPIRSSMTRAFEPLKKPVENGSVGGEEDISARNPCECVARIAGSGSLHILGCPRVGNGRTCEEVPP